MAIKILFKPASINDEVKNVWNTFVNAPFLLKNGYKYNIPDSSEIKSLFQKVLKTGSLSVYYFERIKAFICSNYQENDYKNALSRINTRKGEINFLNKYLDKYQKEWGFKKLSNYNIILTLYGAGGYYDHTNGGINLNCNFTQDPIITIIHEIIHIGVEGFIQEFKMNHMEKERIVDLLCARDINIKKYRYHFNGKLAIDRYIIKNKFNVPLALKEYVEDFPRM